MDWLMSSCYYLCGISERRRGPDMSGMYLSYILEFEMYADLALVAPTGLDLQMHS